MKCWHWASSVRRSFDASSWDLTTATLARHTWIRRDSIGKEKYKEYFNSVRMFPYLSTQEKNHKHLLPLQISNAYTSSQHGRQVRASNAARDIATNRNVAIPWQSLSCTTFLAFKNRSNNCTSQIAEFSISVFIFKDYSKLKKKKKKTYYALHMFPLTSRRQMTFKGRMCATCMTTTCDWFLVFGHASFAHAHAWTIL